MMKSWLVIALTVALTATLAPGLSEAKRLGGGKSQGMQRSAPPSNTPQQAAPKPATPAQAAPATAGAAPAAAAGKRSWLGPIAGLAAGLGIAALLSHFGMGEGMANILMIALLAGAAFFVIRFLLRRFGPAPQRPALAAAGPAATEPAWAHAQRTAQPEPVAAPAAFTRTEVSSGDVSVTGAPLAPMGATMGATIDTPTGATAAAAEPAPTGFVLPAGFDLPAFERIAKMIFIRLQAANDSADLEDLRQFTTPELFAALRLDLQERANAPQQTDVEQVDAEVIDFADEGTRQLVSVRFHGMVREAKGADATKFDEIWHLVKPADDSRSWAIAGIQQPQ